MSLSAVRVNSVDLQHLPVPARSRVEPADVVVLDGYKVEALVVGLSFPTGSGRGNPFVVHVAGRQG